MSTNSNPAFVQSATIVRTLPLTEAQREIWFGAQISDLVSCSFNQSMLVHLHGSIELNRLKQAAERLVHRHEALRMTFDPAGETQRLHAIMPLNIDFEDLSTLSAAVRGQTLRQRMEEEATAPFNLVTGPLFRFRVLRSNDEEHVLIVTLHHIICDGCSVAILLEEMAKLYAAGEGAPLADVEMSYSQFIQAQNASLREPARKLAEEFWLREFSRPVPGLELPLDRTRPSRPAYTGASGGKLLDQTLSQDVKKLSAQHRCSLMTTLLATFYLLLQRLGDQADIVVGLPMTSRAGSGSENLVGHCVNFLPLRLQVDQSLSFTQHLGRLWQLLVRAQEHQNFTLGSLLQKLNLPREQSRMPLTSVMFNLDWVQDPLTIPGLALELQLNPCCQARFDLSLSVSDQHGQLELFVQYSSELFDRSTIDRWLMHYETLLRAAASNPGLPLVEFPQLQRPDGTVEVNDGPRAPLFVDGMPGPGAQAHDTSAPPMNFVEEAIAQIWREVILLDEVGRRDNFFDVGGHSLLATKVVARIAKTLQVELPVRIVFERPTIAELAEAVDRARIEQSASPVAGIRRNHPPAREILLKRLEKLSAEDLRALLQKSKTHDPYEY